MIIMILIVVVDLLLLLIITTVIMIMIVISMSDFHYFSNFFGFVCVVPPLFVFPFLSSRYRCSFEDRRVALPYLLLVMDEDVSAQRMGVAISEFHRAFALADAARAPSSSSGGGGDDGSGAAAASSGTVIPVLSHPTFVAFHGASGGGAGGTHTGAVNYVHHVLASDGAMGGLMVLAKELTNLCV